MRLVQLPNISSTVLDHAVVVVPVASSIEQVTTLGTIRAALGEPGDASEVLVNMSGVTLSVSADVQRLIASSRRDRKVVFEVGSVSVDAGEGPHETIALRSGAHLYEVLSDPNGVAEPLGPAGRRRLNDLTGLRSASVTADDKFDDAIAQVEDWRRNLLVGYDRVDNMDALVKDAEALASKKFAGPSSFNKFVDLRDERDAAIRALGFSDYETFLRERSNLVKQAEARIVDLADQRDRLDPVLGADSAEVTILELHRDIEAKLGRGSAWGVDAGSVRARHLLRHNLSSALVQVLSSAGVYTTTENVFDATTQHLAAMRSPGERLRSSRIDDLIGHVAALAGASDVGPLPAVVIGAGALFPDGYRHQRMAGLMQTAATMGQQLIFIEPTVTAGQLKMSLLHHLTEQVAI
jgi:hypothetical protein